jgi:tetratricopeptide (TPR) repeat protein
MVHSSVPASEAMEVIDDDLEVVQDGFDATPIPGDYAPEGVSEDEEPPFALRSSAPPPNIAENPAQRVRQILLQVESLRRNADYHHAVLTLQTGVSAMPAARELREKLCDLLIESGDQEQAIVEMLGFASYLGQTGDGDGAARLLDEVLLLDPQNEAALSMLAQLGYAVPETGEQSADIVYADPAYSGESYAGGPPTGQHQYGELGYADPSEPLPSYDLEGTDDVLAPPSLMGRARTPSGGGPVVQLDDPFQGEALPGYAIPAAPPAPFQAAPFQPAPFQPAPFQPAPFQAAPFQAASLQATGSNQALPPPPHADPYGAGDGYAQPPRSRPSRPEPLPSFPIDEPTHYGLTLDPSALHQPRLSDPAQLDESALEEMEFFQSHGMFDEAMGLLTEQLARLPNHPLLLERQRELLALRDGHQEAPVQTESQPVDRSFDIASALGGLDALDSVAPPPPPQHQPQQQISVETVFEQFKAGVAAQVADNDAATHYDLGVAYREMGLVADAINEFELASRDPTRECVAQSMIGMMHMEQSNVDQAIDAFIRGLHASQKSSDQELALTYEIGNAYEFRQNREQALYYFQLVARNDPNYRDPRGSVEERISNLDEPREPGQRAAAGGGADEFDAAFDDLFDGPKR